MFITTFTNGETITDYSACEYTEGFGNGENASLEDSIRAWAYLIRTGLCWKLQGWYGRNAQSLIDNKIISSEGIIDYNVIETLK